MRRCLAVLPLLFLATAALAAPKWITFNDPGGAYTVKMPIQPALQHDSVTNTDGKPVPMLEYTVDRQSNAMIVIVSDLTAYPDADPDHVMKGAVSGAEGSASKLLGDKPIKLNRQKGHDVTLIDKDGNKIEDRIFFLGGRLYQVMTVIPPKATKRVKADSARFLGSFRFTGH